MGFSRQEYWSGLPLPSLLALVLVGVYLPLWLNLGEGNGKPLQYSCLANPMDGGAWKAAVHEVTKSRT